MAPEFHITQYPPLSLYVHLPWCIRKCPYCDFNSHEPDNGRFDETAYIDALISDFIDSYPLVQGRELNSIFIGGGTPSLFSADSLDRLLTAVDQNMGIHTDTEITLEANPGAADNERFAGYRQIGINRLSIGIQSFNPGHLEAIGRVHDVDQAHNAVGFARDAGFAQINLDLMYGLPGQTLEQAMDDLSTAINHDTVHLSWYQLTLEPNTLFHARPPALPSEDKIDAIQEEGRKSLADGGFVQYEISAYARDENYCRHNLNYWQFGDYLGIGAGAHSKITDIHDNVISRYTRHKNPERYMHLAGDGKVVTGNRDLTVGDIVLEYMMNTLRLPSGVHVQTFKQRTGLSLTCLTSQLDNASQKGLLVMTDDKIMPTAKGLNYLNDLLQCFMSETENVN